MPSNLALAVIACLANACTYVGLLYIWRGSLPRNHPETIKRRLLSTGLACCVAWLPVYCWARHIHRTQHPVPHLLGLRLTGLPRAVFDALYLCVTLFAGPLVYYLHSFQSPTAQPQQHRSSAAPSLLRQRGRSDDDGSGANSSGYCAVGDRGTEPNLRRPGLVAEDATSGSDGTVGDDASGHGVPPESPGAADGSASSPSWLGFAMDLQRWRNLVAAPLTEEFVFRACMAPLLVLEGVNNVRVVLLTPLFFGAAHLHHVFELTRHQRLPLGRAIAAAGFQMAYTTVFGWLATYLFLRTGHLAAPVVAHAFCNWAGFPPFADMAVHPRGALLLLTTLAGVATFALALPRMTKPERYQQDFYLGW